MGAKRIEFTIHADVRQEQRTISRDQVRSAIQNGGKRPLPGKGKRGGVMKRFSYPTIRGELIVIAELFRETYYVVTTYWSNHE